MYIPSTPFQAPKISICRITLPNYFLNFEPFFKNSKQLRLCQDWLLVQNISINTELFSYMYSDLSLIGNCHYDDVQSFRV